MNSFKKSIIATIIATISFSLLFLGIGFNFWIQMTLSVAGLVALSFAFDKNNLKRLTEKPKRGWIFTISIGLLSAAVLYLVFYIGNIVVRLILDSSGQEISNVYDLKANTSKLLIAILIAFVIGPGEEIFWRGYIQTQFEKRYGLKGLLLAVFAYGVVHVASGNMMLLIAALVCGAFWTLTFHYFKSIWINIISHIAWDLAVFLLFPFE